MNVKKNSKLNIVLNKDCHIEIIFVLEIVRVKHVNEVMFHITSSIHSSIHSLVKKFKKKFVKP